MAAFTLAEILGCTGGALLAGKPRQRVSGVSTDTRSVRRGQVFVAIKGEKFDAHDLLDQAVAKGATALLVSRKDMKIPPGVAAVLVEDTVKAFGHMAQYHRRRFNIPLIAVTGSAGKTSTKELIAAVMKKKYRVLFNKGTENNHMGVPATLLKLDGRYEAAVIEMGTNHPGEIAWLAGIAHPTVAVFTNVGASHLEGLGSPEGVFKEKVSLLKFLPDTGCVVVNADDPYWARLLKKRLLQKVISYGIDAKADVKASVVHLKEGCSYFKTAGGKPFMVKSPSWGAVQNALAAIACGRLLGVPWPKVQQAVKAAKPARGRQCWKKAKGVVVIDDTYNANPVSYENAFRTLNMVQRRGRVVVAASDMLELGRTSDELHARIGKSAAASKIDALFTCGERSRMIGRAAAGRDPELDVRHFADQAALAKELKGYLRSGDVLLVKGSRGMRMEKVVEDVLVFLKG